MDQQRERKRSERELKASIAELAAALLEAIAGGRRLHKVPRQIEKAARAIRAHGDADGAGLTFIVEALTIEDTVAIAQRFRSLISCEEQDRETVESLHED